MAVEKVYRRLAIAMLVAWLLATMSLWWFAFYGVGEVDSNWLERARSACFGTDQSGLPDTYGWMVLVLAPMFFLSALILALGSEVWGGLTELSSNVLGKVVIIVLISTAVYESAWAREKILHGIKISRAPELTLSYGDLPEFYPRTNKAAPNFRLLNHLGEQVSLSDFKGDVCNTYVRFCTL